MKRVIYLSWFKRLLDRLVTEENEDSEKVSNQNDQHANAKEEQGEKERPTFRFPIITDAEIYGWDDDEENIQITKTKNVPIKTTTIDEFEPIPLYQNERWPGKDVQTNIHRAGKKNNQKKIVEQEIIDEPIEHKPIIKKSRSFSPTKVPSPIYGFSNNKPSKMYEAEVEAGKEETNNFKEEPMYNSEPVEPNDDIFTMQEIDIPSIKEEPVLEPYQETIVEPEVMAEETIEEEKDFIEQEHRTQNQEPEQELEQEPRTRTKNKQRRTRTARTRTQNQNQLTTQPLMNNSQKLVKRKKNASFLLMY